MRIDVLVLFATVVWGCNYVIVKTALHQIPELGFNALRLGVASILFLGVLAFDRDPTASRADPPDWRRVRTLFASARRMSGRDRLAIAGLGVIGHFAYQLCFMAGLARSTVSNSSLIIGSSPVVVTALTRLVGQERVSRAYWLGAALSLAGVYLVVGAGAALGGESLTGDLITLLGVCCWAIYAVGARPMMRRHSPLVVTGYSMAVGTALYFPLGIPTLARLDWAGVPAGAWVGLVCSAVFALFVAYLIWHTSILRVGNVRTAMYSNLTPIVALVTAVTYLGDRLTTREIAGAAAILVGVGIARLTGSGRQDAPAEE